MRKLTDYEAYLAKAGPANFNYQKRDDSGPSMAEVAETMDKIGRTFEEFKAKNNERLAEIEKKGSADVITAEELNRINAGLDVLEAVKKEMEQVQIKLARPQIQQAADNHTPEQREHLDAFLAYLRSPNDVELRGSLQQMQTVAQKQMIATKGIQMRDVDGTVGASGGFAVPQIIAQQVAQNLLEVSDVRQLVKVVTAGSPDYKELVDLRGLTYGWVGETDTRTATATPTLGEVSPTFGTLYAYPKATEESLNDIFFNVQDWITRSMVEGFAEGTENAVYQGTGTNMPTGFLAGPTPTDEADGTRAFGTLQYIPTADAAVILSNSIITLAGSVKAGYRANAQFTMNRSTTTAIRLLVDGQGNYLWQPGYQMGNPNLLVGYPIWTSEQMPDIAGDAFPVAFGDFRAGYVLVDLVGFRLTPDPITEPGYVKWYGRRRMGGQVLKSEAIKLLKVALT